MQFLLDRNLPEQLARMLGHYDRAHTVLWLDDRFDKATPDVAWLTAAGDWVRTGNPTVVVSGDGRILSNEAEAQVLAGQPLSFFHFAPAWLHLGWREMAWKAVKVWPEIVANSQPPRPTIYTVPISATKVEVHCPTSQLGQQRRRR